MLFILSALTLLAIPAHASPEADPCSTVRLDVPGGSMEHVALRNQEQIGSCYSHVAAQIYDSWRFSHGDKNYKEQSSGFEIGQRYKIREGRSTDEVLSINGGDAESIIPMLVEQGSCSQRELDLLVKKGTIDEYASQIMKIFWEHRNQYYKLKNPKFSSFKLKDFQSTRNDARTELMANRFPIDNTRAKVIDHPELLLKLAQDEFLRKDVLEKAVEALREYNDKALVMYNPWIRYEDLKADGDTVDMFDAISIINCTDSKKLKISEKFHLNKQRTYYSKKRGEGFLPSKFASLIHREFDKGISKAFPIGINYCSSILQAGKNYNPPSMYSKECGRHASLVIGRQRNPKTNRCEFLIRNTWGKSDNYSADWTLEKSKGQVWVDSEMLGKSVYGVRLVEAN